MELVKTRSVFSSISLLEAMKLMDKLATKTLFVFDNERNI